MIRLRNSIFGVVSQSVPAFHLQAQKMLAIRASEFLLPVTEKVEVWNGSS